jgi:oligopeptidase B
VTDHLVPPVAQRVPHTWPRTWGDVDDPWAWLRDRDDPATLAYLRAENDYADAWLAPHRDTIETVFQEIKRRTLETDVEVPVRKDGWWYVSRTEEGADYAIHCRGRTRDTATEQVLLDENIEADGHEYFSLAIFDVSPDHRWLAWAADLDGSEEYTVRFRDLATGLDRDEVLTDVSEWGGSAWSADSSTFFYLRADIAKRPFELWRHTLGTTQADDVLVLTEPDERFNLGVELSRSGEWIVVGAASSTTSEQWVLPAALPTAAPRPVADRRPGVQYLLDHWGDRFVVLTNLDAVDFRVVTAPLDEPGSWSELLPHVSGQRIDGIEPFADHLAVHEWVDAQQRVRIVRRDGSVHVVDLGPEPHEMELDSNPEWAATTLRYRYQSLVTPASVHEMDLRTGEHVLLKQRAVPNTDLGAYETVREWAMAPDGARVPVDIVRRRGTPVDGSRPCLVYGYGSYEASVPPWFSVARLSLLDRGWTWALVHPRGGGELGRRWYLEGKLEHKRNTFTDTIACVEHLVAGGHAAPDRVVIRGGSAGGLLVGACMTMRPELFVGVIAEVPFVDVVTTMFDASLPLTTVEWEEWGDPRDPEMGRYMASYSPYDNTVATAYPALFITAGLNDGRVSYHEPAKWCAKLRAARTDSAAQIMRTELGAGHGGPSGRYDLWREEATFVAFALAVAGD